MQHMLVDIERAMTDEDKAVELLQRNIDSNHMTLELASIILDGFMETQDPFTTERATLSDLLTHETGLTGCAGIFEPGSSFC